MAKNPIKSEQVINKTFNFSKGVISLNFTLRIDTKDQLKDFLELLKEAVSQVEVEINK